MNGQVGNPYIVCRIAQMASSKKVAVETLAAALDNRQSPYSSGELLFMWPAST